MKLFRLYQALHRCIAVATLAATALTAHAAPSLGFQILGRVVNGTTGEPVSPATIRIVNPSGGMLTEQEVQTIDASGHFTVEDLADEAPVYLLRVEYKGVNYTQMVRPQGDEATVEIAVYEPTVSWDHVHVSVPHVIVARSNDTLLVEKFIQIENHSSPPKTIYGPGAKFSFYLPSDLLGVAAVQVMSLGVPLPVVPQETDEPGFYTMDYPIRPGDTQVSVSLQLPYDGGRYNYIDKFKHPIDEMMLITRDRSINVSSSTAELESVEDFHGFKAFTVAGLGPQKPLELVIQGGSATAPMTTGPQIFVVQSETFTVSIITMILLTIVLIGILATTAGYAPTREVAQKILEDQKEQLLAQLAKLDDLYKMGAVSDVVYDMKRPELVNMLAYLYQRLSYDAPESPQRTGRKEDPARV